MRRNQGPEVAHGRSSCLSATSCFRHTLQTSGWGEMRQRPRVSGDAIGTELYADSMAPRIARRGLFVILGYLLFTLALYAYGPSTFAKHAVGETVVLVLAYMVLFAAGYLFTTQQPGAVHCARGRPATSLRTVQAIILVGLIVAVVNLGVYTSLDSASMDNLLDTFAASLQDPGAAYYDSFAEAQQSGPLIWALVLMSPISWPAFALSVAYFGRLSIRFRSVVLALFVVEAARWILEGKNKGAFDLVIILTVVLWIKSSQRRIEGAALRIKTRTATLVRTLFILTCALGAMTLFTRAISSRTNNLTAVIVAEPGPLLVIVPDWLQPTFVAVSIYLGQGYHALSYLPHLEWNPTYGAGHSLFLSIRLDQYFDSRIVDRMYQSQLPAYGIDPSVNWHSLYVWLANDVHWLGVLPVMFLLGRFTARVVLRALLSDSASNYALLALVAIMMVFVPANAQVFQEPTTFMAFWGLILYQSMLKPSRVLVVSSRMNRPSTSGTTRRLNGSNRRRS